LKEQGDTNIQMLNKDVSTAIKGVASVFIMLGHFLPATTPNLLRLLFYGPVWVGVFFFFSGYGLKHKANQDKRYLEGFIINKIKAIWIPFAIAELIYLISAKILNNIEINLGTIIGSIIGYRLSNDVLWYVVELLILELLFFVLEKTISDTSGRIYYVIWMVFYIVFLILSVVRDIGTWWFISTSTFLIGIWTEDNITTVNRLVKSKLFGTCAIISAAVLYLLTLSAEVFGIGFSPLPITYWITALTMVLVPLFALATMIVAEKMPSRSKLWMYVGKVSYEIYLYHVCVKMWVSKFLSGIVNEVIILIIESIITVIFAVIANKAKKRVLRIGYREKNI